MKKLVALGLALVVAAALAACGTAGSEVANTTGTAASTITAEPISGQTISVSNWADYLPEGVIKGFEKESGVKVKTSVHASNEEIVGKLQASQGRGYDVVFISGPFVQQLAQRGWLAKLNPKLIPNRKNLPAEATDLPYDPGNAVSIPYAWSATGICYRADKLKKTPDSWWDVLRPPAEARGKTTMVSTDRWLMLPALKVLGYSLNTKDEAELNEAKELLIEAKKTLLAYDDSTFQDKLASGQAYISEAWDGWCNYGTSQNPNVKFVVPKEGSDLGVDTMTVLESSDHKAAASAFIDYVLRPESGKAIAEGVLYKVANEPGMALVDPKLMKQFPNLATTPAELAQGETETYLGDAAPLWSQIVSEVKAG